MINFLRRIRRNMMTEKKSDLYLLYALGEIVLVVIGILIALQIDNWNAMAKERSVEIKILQEIQNNLEHDLVEIRSDIDIMDSVNTAINDINRFIMTDSIPSEAFYYDMAKIRVNPHFDPNKSGYNLLVSKGVEIILNDSLRGSLSLLYESLYSYYYRYEEERTQFKLNEIDPFLLRYFQWQTRPELLFFGRYYISPDDYIKLKNDANFSKLLYAVAFANTVVQDRAYRVDRGIDALISEIKNELDTRED